MTKRFDPKSKSHLKSHSPSSSPPTSISHSKSPTPRPKVAKTTIKSPSTLPKSSDQPLSQEISEVQTLIQKLEGISISKGKPQQFELSESSVSSSFQSTCILTHSQSEKLGVTPFEFPLPSHQRKTKKFEAQSSTSENLSSTPPQTPSFHTSSPFFSPPLNPPFHSVPFQSIGIDSTSTSIGATYSSTQLASSTIITLFTQVPIIAGRQQNPLAARPWTSPGVIQMEATLHPLPKNPKIWLPKFNPNDGLPTEEHLHDFMLAININGVVE